MKMYSVDMEFLNEILNNGKEILLFGLQKDGAGVDAEELSGKYALIVREKGFFGGIWDKVRGYKTDMPRIELVKMVSIGNETTIIGKNEQ